MAQKVFSKEEPTRDPSDTDAATTQLYLEQVASACEHLAAVNKAGAGGSGTLSAPPTPLSDSPSFSGSTPVPAHLVPSSSAARRIVQDALNLRSTPPNSSAP